MPDNATTMRKYCRGNNITCGSDTKGRLSMYMNMGDLHWSPEKTGELAITLMEHSECIDGAWHGEWAGAAWKTRVPGKTWMDSHFDEYRHVGETQRFDDYCAEHFRREFVSLVME